MSSVRISARRSVPCIYTILTAAKHIPAGPLTASLSAIGRLQKPSSKTLKSFVSNLVSDKMPEDTGKPEGERENAHYIKDSSEERRIDGLLSPSAYAEFDVNPWVSSELVTEEEAQKKKSETTPLKRVNLEPEESSSRMEISEKLLDQWKDQFNNELGLVKNDEEAAKKLFRELLDQHGGQ